MVTPGQSHATKAAPPQIGEATVTALRRTVPAAVPGNNSVFSALHGMPERTGDEKGVRLSVKCMHFVVQTLLLGLGV